MSSIAKKISLVVVMMLLSVGVVIVIGQDEPKEPFITTSAINSIYDFTNDANAQIDDSRVIDETMFISIDDQDKLLLSNRQFDLYFDANTTGIKVRNKVTNYVWSSIIDNVDAGTFNGLLSSSVGLEYINIAQNHSTRQNIGLVDTIHQLDQNVVGDTLRLSIQVEGFCTSRQCSQFVDEYLSGNPNYGLERIIALGFVNLDLSFDVEMHLTTEGVRVHVPFTSIAQGNQENIVLSSLILFPGLGATLIDETPGYMVVPDGVGALVRYKNNEGQFVASYEERFYGGNQGITSIRTSATNQRLMMPIFGMVHGINQHAMLGVIESGDLSSRLIVNPSGANNVLYNLIYPKYDLNQTYLQSFTRDGLGGVQRIHQNSTSSITVHYQFLTSDRANYVGMAKQYQDYLISTGVLTPIKPMTSSIPLHTQVIMSDSRTQFIGTETIVMSTLEQTKAMVSSIELAGITNLHLSLLGWNHGGYSGYLPSPLRFASDVGSRREFEAFFSENQNTPIYLLNNYVYAASENGRVRYRRDVAMGVNRFRLEKKCSSCVYETIYTLYPNSSARLAFADLEAVVANNVHVLFEDLAKTAFSYNQGDSYMRQDTLATYREIMQAYEGYSGYSAPNAYAWEFSNVFFDTPLFHSQLKIFDETVPLLHVVLAGYMELFSAPLNFNSNGRAQLLRMVDFHVYPSYVISSERSSSLKGSDIEQFFATGFSSWEQTIIDEYAFLNEALQHVYGATLIGRTRVKSNVIVTQYDNQVQIIINYGLNSVIVDGILVEGQSYHVVGGVS